MNRCNSIEIAYKRGYDAGYAKAEKDILNQLSDLLNKKNWIKVETKNE